MMWIPCRLGKWQRRLRCVVTCRHMELTARLPVWPCFAVLSRRRAKVCRRVSRPRRRRRAGPGGRSRSGPWSSTSDLLQLRHLPPSTSGPLLTLERIKKNTQEPLTGWTRTHRCARAMMRKTSEIKEAKARDPGAHARPGRDARVNPVFPLLLFLLFLLVSSDWFLSSRCLWCSGLQSREKNSSAFPLKTRLIWSQVSVFFTFGAEAENKGRLEAMSPGLEKRIDFVLTILLFKC